MDMAVDNIPRYYTIIAEMMSCWVYFFLFKQKQSTVKIVFYTVIVASLEIFYLWVSESIAFWLWPAHMIILFSIMFLYMKLVIKRSSKTVFYYTTKAFLVAEFIAAFEWQIVYFYKWNTFFAKWAMGIVMILFYSVCLVLAYFLERKWGRDSQYIEITMQENIIAVTIAIAVFFLSNIGFFMSNTPFSGGSMMDLFAIRTISDFLGLVLLFAFQSRIAQAEMKNNLAILDQNLREQYNKYRNYQDSINLINMKYHDLRHQMENLKELVNGKEEMLLINNIESELREYRPYFRTGNDVLNALLDSRRTLWNNNRITITAVADGKLLEFMNVADICSVIGNALDNALESVCLIEEIDKRLIHIEIAEQKSFVMIVVENTCEQHVKFENGLPKTTHKDKKNHGYGTQSILQVVQKYDGSVVFDQTGDWFSMKILLPAKQF